MGLNWSKYKSEYVSFNDVGDAVQGTIISVSEGQDFKGNPCPQLVIDTTDGARTVTAGQAMLKAALAEKEPLEGDYITITYSGVGEGKPGRAPAKLFTVALERGSGQAVGAADIA